MKMYANTETLNSSRLANDARTDLKTNLMQRCELAGFCKHDDGHSVTFIVMVRKRPCSIDILTTVS
jgi:hypothetical protein